jgi:LysM repeat protein
MTPAGQESLELEEPPSASTDGPDFLPDARLPSGHSDRPTTGTICPYLMAASGGWRSAAPHREHRCTGVDPAAPLSAEKQRRLCLSLAHLSCPTYGAARAARAATIAPGVDPAALAAMESARRPLARSASIILEQPRLTTPSVSWPLDRAVSQAALVGLMILAFSLVLIARLSAGNAGAAASASPSPSASAVAETSAPSSIASDPPSPPPSEAVPSASAAPPATPTPAPAFRTTYTVKSGDTLLGIASHYGTTVAAIKKLNGLSSSTLHIGQKLKIP